MSKSRDAFRTISEVSDALDTPAHVLRFWESKFTQVKPVKRAGGRRYYRPADVDLLAGIKRLLHDDGMTIKGAQKLLREQGVKHVGALGAETLDHDDAVVDVTPDPVVEDVPVDVAPAAMPDPVAAPEPEGEVKITNVVPIETPKPGPALSLNLGSKPDPKLEPEAEEVAPPPDAATPDIPADPSDNDSKAPARIFHLLHKAAPEKLAMHAAEIAPLLDRMQVLRDRIAAR